MGTWAAQGHVQERYPVCQRIGSDLQCMLVLSWTPKTVLLYQAQQSFYREMRTVNVQQGTSICLTFWASDTSEERSVVCISGYITLPINNAACCAGDVNGRETARYPQTPKPLLKSRHRQPSRRETPCASCAAQFPSLTGQHFPSLTKASLGPGINRANSSGLLQVCSSP